jgi:nucleoside-diphosphate-sugar epimerase
MTVLLTGASGFLGRHVLPLLLAEGHEVIAVGRTPNFPLSPQVSLVQADLCDLSAQSLGWAKLDAVIHLAAAGVKAAQRQWTTALRTNIAGSFRLLSLIAARARPHTAVFLGGTYYERFAATNAYFAENPYIATKATFSRLAETWAESHAGPVVFGSIFQVYGPGDDPGNVLSYAARCFRQRETAVIGSGIAARDWIYVADAARAILRAVHCQQVGIHHWDIGTGSLSTLKEMVLTLADVAGAGPEAVRFDPSRDRPDQFEPIAASGMPPDWRALLSNREGLEKLLASL